jgi:tryptophanyl-tRNA synthetase
MATRISGFKPTGHLQLGNYVGAIRPTLAGQHQHDTRVFIADLQAMTVPHDPKQLNANTYEVAALLVACGLDLATTPLYVQSQLSAHFELHYLLECAATYGEMHRMIQFKEKGGGSGTRLSLLTYPALMAADILVHDIAEVPVGADQGQHVELTRDIATRFNTLYGETFVIPRAVHPPVAARLKDLSYPTAKMGKTNAAPGGVLFLLDEPDVLRRKVMRAVTDAEREVRYMPDTKPGVSNLLDILAVTSGGRPDELATQFGSYGELKTAVADSVVDLLAPVQARYRELTADPRELDELLAHGVERVRDRADATVRRARTAMGLASPSGRAYTPPGVFDAD